MLFAVYFLSLYSYNNLNKCDTKKKLALCLFVLYFTFSHVFILPFYTLISYSFSPPLLLIFSHWEFELTRQVCCIKILSLRYSNFIKFLFPIAIEIGRSFPITIGRTRKSLRSNNATYVTIRSSRFKSRRFPDRSWLNAQQPIISFRRIKLMVEVLRRNDIGMGKKIAPINPMEIWCIYQIIVM